MREVFRHSDFTTVGYYHSLLEAEGIATMFRNQHLQMTGLAEIPIPEFYPNICVMYDEDYERAVTLLKDAMVENEVASQEEKICEKCKEPNPGNFELCYACGNIF